jgi:hypothetical protein
VNRALAAVFLLLCSRSAGATVTWPLDLTVDLSVIRDLSAETALEVRVFGVEMVEIPEGAFTLGDPDPAALKFAAFYRSNAAGSPDRSDRDPIRGGDRGWCRDGRPELPGRATRVSRRSPGAVLDFAGSV